jgi:hypothetical protein
LLNHDFDDRIKNGTDRRKLTTCMEWNKLHHLQECSQDKERNGAEQSKQENIVFSSTMTLTTCMEWKNGTERNGQNKKTEFSSTLTLTTGKNGTDHNGTER